MPKLSRTTLIETYTAEADRCKDEQKALLKIKHSMPENSAGINIAYLIEVAKESVYRQVVIDLKKI